MKLAKELVEEKTQVELAGRGRLARHRFNEKFNEIRIEFSIEMASMQDSMIIEREGFLASSPARAQPRAPARVGTDRPMSPEAETF